MWKIFVLRWGNLYHTEQKSYSYGTDEEELNKSYVEICTIQTKNYSYGTDEEELNKSYVEICTIQRKSCSYGTDE